MGMTKIEYAEAVAKKMTENTGIAYEVTEVTKANGVIFTGIHESNPELSLRPTVYIDDDYKNETPIDEAAEKIQSIIAKESGKTLDLDFLRDYESVKKHLRARLYNNKTKVEVYQSAKRYGFDDLIITPVVMVPKTTGLNIDGLASTKVTKALLESWGVTKAEVIKQAMKNSEDEVVIMSMREMLLETGYPEFMLPEENSDGNMTCITNSSRVCGAISVILARKKLKKMFPEGYMVLPSSIHEVLVISASQIDEGAASSMVNEVNDTNVVAEEQLGYKSYIIAA